MAQLIKLQDYISRYEWNTYRYPGQYIRLKQEHWQNLQQLWEEQLLEVANQDTETVTAPRFAKLKTFIKREKELETEVETAEELLPPSENELKQYFLDKLLPFQLKWASSTISDVSFIDHNYVQDETLRYLLQRFPDNYLVMYYPIFSIKNAPIDGDIILISPIAIEIIHLLEGKPGTTFMASDERSWTKEEGNTQGKILSPLIALKRTEQIVKSILNKHDVEFPVIKTVLSRTNAIIYSNEPFNTRIIGKHEYADWFQAKRTLTSPLKNRQLKAAEQLLKHCLTSAVKRPEWEEDGEIFPTVGEE